MERSEQADIPPGNTTAAEDRRKHLEFIQAVVARMSSASVSAKSWLLPVVTATYGYGMTKNAWSVIALGMGAVLLFMFLDAHYLDQEKKFRALYDAVARDIAVVPVFSMDPRPVLPVKPRVRTRWRKATGQAPSSSTDMTAEQAFEHEQTAEDQSLSQRVTLAQRTESWSPDDSVWWSWSITPFYGSLFLVGVGLLVRVILF